MTCLFVLQPSRYYSSIGNMDPLSSPFLTFFFFFTSYYFSIQYIEQVVSFSSLQPVSSALQNTVIK